MIRPYRGYEIRWDSMLQKHVIYFNGEDVAIVDTPAEAETMIDEWKVAV